MRTNTDAEAWFELLTDTVAHYVDDTTSEVFLMAADAPYFLRVREDDQTFKVSRLTNDRYEHVNAEASFTWLDADTFAAILEVMLKVPA